MKIVVDKDLYCPEHEKIIRRLLAYRFGENMRINFLLVDEISKERRGRFAIIKNNIKV